MPLIFFAVGGYAAGLMLGFGGDFVIAIALALLGAAAALVRREHALMAVGALVASGAGVAALHERAQLACVAAAAARRAWDVRLDQSVAEGGFSTGVVAMDGCRTGVAVSVARGEANAGDLVRVVGSAVPGPRGILIKRAALFGAERDDWLRALRGASAAHIDSAFGEDAPLAKSLLIAETRDLDPALRDRFAAAGIIHMLSISGLHVGIIAMALQLLFRAARLPRSGALIATVVVTAFYVALIGAPPPALRSGAMLGVGALTRLAERPTSPWAVLALGAAVPLVDPTCVLEVGWQLSVLGIAGLIASGALAKRWLVPPRFRGLRRSLATALLISVVASLVSAPLVTWTFGRLSLVAPLANLAAGPIVAIAQPTLFLALLLSPVPGAAHFVAGAAHPMLLALDGVAAWSAAVPYASITVAPTLIAAVLGGVATIAMIAACVSRFPARALILGGAAIAVSAWTPFVVANGSGEMELHAIDVGQGDALALRTPRGHWILVDAGRTWRGGDAGRAAVIPYVQRFGGPVDLFVLSHPHADHVGGAASVIAALHPRAYWDGGYVLAEPSYRASLDAAVAAHVRWHRAHPRDSIVIDSVHIVALAPDSAFQARQENPNEASIVLLVRYGSVRFLLMGDAETGAESWLESHDSLALRADVLKVGHHGSKTSSGATLLRLVQPKVAIVSVGIGNSYGHPSRTTMRALAAAGAQIFRTDQLGSIVVRSDGRSITVNARGSTWTIPAKERGTIVDR